MNACFIDAKPFGQKGVIRIVVDSTTQILLRRDYLRTRIVREWFSPLGQSEAER